MMNCSFLWEHSLESARLDRKVAGSILFLGAVLCP